MKRESRLRGLDPHPEAGPTGRVARAQGANRLGAIYTPAFEPAILWVRALDSRTDIFGCRFSIQAATALPLS